MSVIYKGSIDGSSKILKPVIIGNSDTVAVGDYTKTYDNAGFLQRGTAAVPGLGFLDSISEGRKPSVKGTHTAGSTNTSDLITVAAASDNETTGKYWGWVDINRASIYSVSVSGTLGTTATSPTKDGVLGYHIDINSANSLWSNVLETTHTRTLGTPGNFFVHGVDPDDTTRLLVSYAYSELDSVYE